MTLRSNSVKNFFCLHVGILGTIGEESASTSNADRDLWTTIINTEHRAYDEAGVSAGHTRCIRSSKILLETLKRLATHAARNCCWKRWRDPQRTQQECTAGSAGETFPVNGKNGSESECVYRLDCNCDEPWRRKPFVNVVSSSGWAISAYWSCLQPKGRTQRRACPQAFFAWRLCQCERDGEEKTVRK